jgi:hypothetical protein
VACVLCVVLLRLWGGGAGAESVGSVLSEAMETGDVISEAPEPWWVPALRLRTLRG